MNLNCDQVFDVLTRGPFPTGDPSDEAVEIHLARCAECRRLAEALRPALELFEEAVTPEESRDLPGYWGELIGAPDQKAVSCAEREGERHRPPRRLTWTEALARPLASVNTWRIAAAVAFGMSIGLYLKGPGHATPDAKDPQTSGSPAAIGAPNHAISLPALVSRPQPAGLKWSRDCPQLRRAGAASHAGSSQEPILLAQADLSQIDCCTHCHNAENAAQVPASATALVQRSCEVCHAQ